MQFDIRAYLTLLMFVPISLAVFGAVPRHRSVAAIFGVYVGGLMFLPERAAFDLPALPPMDKNSLAALMGLVGTVLLEPRRLIHARPFRGVDMLFFLILIGDAGTVFTNPDTLTFGEDRFTAEGFQYAFQKVIPGLRPYDLLATYVRDFLSIYTPFLLGRAVFRSPEDAEVLLKGFVVVGLIYVLPCLVELRMAPQMHKWVYGYMSANMRGAARGEGFKPVVFLSSGLAVAMFLVTAIVSCCALLKRRVTLMGIPMALPLGLLWVLLAISHNVAALLYSIALVPVALVSRGRFAIIAAQGLAVLVLLYPAIRSFGLIDTDALITWITQYSPERAQSLYVRFANEDELFARASERLWFGWGGYGRNRIYDEIGKNTSITDGEWIISMGGRGLIGFIGIFGLLLSPIFIAAKHIGSMPPPDRRLIDAFALVVAINAVDLLPNSLFTQMPIFTAGALAGLAQGMSRRGRR